ncbi:MULTISPECIES: ClpXP protease specificity-enhancing factor [unclassified Halomonas]|uniref:ClpXP protease specificity-enhancing factor n=1 Tax=unclassified Halomonas TaxID=2609666 RepID=UPI001EF531B9|nr:MULTISPECIES: ClpXP protease specificity-enhancing factor [unclassified Halomonas]MCG7575591.1 ClpXP protease specificity-enhancing factor [Halomonas sp. MMH1-48]MCG7602653.1 ClpXP protease specificity-enhancing factor [Halomonas sp. MM17-34]MCG7611589.1 ClpXP protease specificity-enhancing factor [Halomonas sp. MM17-29]MCG7618470.1 ClpXP protease specificity-enhancing factor [Halomonas sp. DSH1-27]BCB62661.1 stringent starvation protein B [Halomonas sp. A020]
MKSSRPYLARALYEWLLDNELTPYLVVDATQPGVEVPRQFVQNGQIVLNVAPTAVRDLFMENQAIGFNARFGGQPMQVMIPTPALIAIYARENGAGMVFGHEPELDAEGFDEHDDSSDESESAGSEASKPELTLTETTPDTPSSDSSEADTSAAKPKKKPTLRVVK